MQDQWRITAFLLPVINTKVVNTRVMTHNPLLEGL